MIFSASSLLQCQILTSIKTSGCFKASCFLFSSTQEEYWPLLLSLVVFPTMIQLSLLPWLPESPRYLLIEKGNIHATIAGKKAETSSSFCQPLKVQRLEQRLRSALSSPEAVPHQRKHPGRSGGDAGRAALPVLHRDRLCQRPAQGPLRPLAGHHHRGGQRGHAAVWH